MELLEVENLSMNFGGLRAINGVTFKVVKGEILGLIGPNGAGKSTLFNVLSGFYRPTNGRIFYEGNIISGLSPEKIAQRGIARTFQQTIISKNSTVFSNVLMGCYMICKTSVIREFFHTKATVQRNQQVRQRAREILEFIGIAHLQNELAGNLPHGHQRLLAISMALAGNPKLLLLDEPVTGMNPTEMEATMARIKQIRDSGITVIMVEHSMRAVMNICGRLVVLNYGQKIADGLPAEVRQNKEVIEAYLGKEGA